LLTVTDRAPLLTVTGWHYRGLGEKLEMPRGFGIASHDIPARTAAKQPDRLIS